MFDSRVKFRHLQTLVEVARQKSVTKAAALLNVSQPAVTKTIRELEEAIGVAVFEREGRSVKLTRYGEVFLKHAGAALTALRQGFDSVSQERFHEAPLIRIGALPTVSTLVMPEAMALFLAQSSGTSVKIVTGENAVLLEQLRIGDLDLVVGRLAAADKMAGFSFEHLYSEPVVFAVCPEHPLLSTKRSLFEALSDYVVIMPTTGSIIRPIVENFLVANGVASLPHQIETVSDSFGRAFVRKSEAVWIISSGVVAADVDHGLLAILPINASETKGPVGLTVRAESTPSLPLTHFMQTIRDSVLRLSTSALIR